MINKLTPEQKEINRIFENFVYQLDATPPPGTTTAIKDFTQIVKKATAVSNNETETEIKDRALKEIKENLSINHWFLRKFKK